ncbi:MAG: Permease of the drug/metabolite transporter (DMT) superfamily [uncultured Acetobacteraceae bacterium]|uniref:Permease of the drug/metabolite transporter (DMT) superfamily n=1 Tax=uncultured Acetobacteraceae bacterium TaxID=169975 RepID=A0A6J4JYY6_9PROT|nr:MAG: Permease of the drug/metabolite transporter (DMT) superfamily [uncultured Acetobacteraceae bacterium]
MQTPSPMAPRDWAGLVALSVLWGGSFFFVGVAVREWPPLSIVLVRVLVAALALWAVVAALRLPVRRDGAALRAALGMGALNNLVPFGLIVWAQGGGLASGVASILNATTPLWAVLVAHGLGAERLTAARAAGAALGFAGVAAMIGVDIGAGLAGRGLAAGAMLLATLSYAFAGVFGRRFAALGVPPLVAAAGQTTASSLLLLPLVPLLEPLGALPAPSPAAVAALAGLGLLSTVFAYLLYFRLLASAGPVNLLLVTLLIPVSAVLLGAVALGEALAPRHALGMAAIAGGLALIDGRLPRRLSVPLRRGADP